MNWKEIKVAIYNLTALSLTRTKPYFISDTSEHSLEGVFALQVVEECTFTTLNTNIDKAGSTDLSSKTLLAGTVLYINVSTIQLLTGSCILYRS